jgi:uncharacterized protein YndB with AHSA1/START domain
MQREFEVMREVEIDGSPEAVWDAITRHADGWMWEVRYEPRVGGAETGLSSAGGVVTAWEPNERFVTRVETDDWFNELSYELAPDGDGTRLRYRHQSVFPADDHDRMLDECELHTDFYLHSLGQYVRHFAGRNATYVSEDVASGAAARRALGVPDDVAVGDRVTLAGGAEGIVDYATAPFLGVRTDDELVRVYGRDHWADPSNLARHTFGAVA